MTIELDGLFTRDRLAELRAILERQRQGAKKAAARRANRERDLRERIAVLERAVMALLVALDAKGVATTRELAAVVGDLALYDEDGDGQVDAADLVRRVGADLQPPPSDPPRRRRLRDR